MSKYFGNRLDNIPTKRAGEGEGGDKGDKGDKGKPDHAKEIEDLKASNKSLLERLDKMDKASGEKKDDPDLSDKAKKEKELADKKVADDKTLESALRFEMQSKEWLKTNASLLPKGIEGIFAAADKEKYANAVEKDKAVKAGIISEFFSIKENVELLTPGLKSALEDYLKLTNTVKQERAQQIYENVFEPAFEMLRRVKKAQHLNNGAADKGSEKAYGERLMKLSREHYLGEKKNA